MRAIYHLFCNYKKEYISKILLAIIAGISISLAFSTADIWITIIIGFSILYYLVSTNISLKKCLCLSYFFFIAGYICALMPWMSASFTAFGVTPFISKIIAILICLLLALLPSCAVVLFKVLDKYSINTLHSSLLFASSMVSVEWVRSLSDLTFPISFGHAHITSVLGNLLPVMGVYGVSFVSMFISAQLTYAYREKKFYIQPLVIISCIFSISYLVAQKDWTYKTGESSVGIVQANIAPEIKWDPTYTKKILHTYSTLTNQLSNNDLIIWPETASPVTYNDAQILIESLKQFTQANANTVILGIVKEVSGQMNSQSFGNYFNSIVAINASSPLYFYNKHKLLPFGEYTPFESILLPLKNLLQIPMSTFMAGDADQPIFRNHNIIASIYLCYEDLFPHYVRKQASNANLLMAISDDVWFGFSQGAYQHLLIARVRAAELGRHLVRATNTGISAFINHKGQIVKRTGELYTQATLSSQVELRQGKTPFAAYGSTPLSFIIILVMLGCIASCFCTFMHKMRNNH